MSIRATDLAEQLRPFIMRWVNDAISRASVGTNSTTIYNTVGGGALDTDSGTATTDGTLLVTGCAISTQGSGYIVTFTPVWGNPYPITAGGASSIGSSPAIAHSDHQHKALTGIASPLSASSVSAEGSSASFARADHVHGHTPGSPTALMSGCINSGGSLTTFARTDHRHALSTTTPGATSASAAASEGTSTCVARADHTHSHTPGSPTALSAGGATAGGTATTLARTDHVHATPAGVPGAISSSATATEGSSGSFARADHTHSHVPGSPVSLLAGAAISGGSLATFSRSDHRHSTLAGAPSACSVSLSAPAEGTSSSFSRADHSHSLAQNIAPTWTASHTFNGDITMAASKRVDGVDLSDLAAAQFLTLATNPELSNERTLSAGSGLTLTDGGAGAAATLNLLYGSTPTTITPDAAASGGTSASVARVDHAHVISTATPCPLAMGNATAEGTSTSFSRSDHVHNTPGFATPTIAAASTAAAGTSTSPIRSDATIAIFNTTAPATIVPDAAAATGSLAYAAHVDHVHAVATAAPCSLSIDVATAEGTSASFARADHIHGASATAPCALYPDNTATEGTSTFISRSDHIHGVPASLPGDITACQITAEGTANYFARSDHQHAVDASDNPGAAQKLLRTTTTGCLALAKLTITNGQVNTGSTQLANLGIGTAPTTNNPVYIFADGSSSTVTPITLYSTFSSSGTTSRYGADIYGVTSYTSGSTRTIGGLRAIGGHSTSTIITNIIGVLARAYTQSASTSMAANFYAQAGANGACQATTAYAYYGETTLGGAANYGVFVYGPNHFLGGKVGIANTCPQYALDVTGCANISHTISASYGTFTVANASQLNASSLSVDGAATINQDLTVGPNILFVDVSGSNVGINAVPDPQFRLDVGGNLRARGWIVGPHALEVKNATLISHFDGNTPYNTDFTGVATGHMGQVPTACGGVIFRPGRFGKAVQLAQSSSNLFPNPSFETGTTYYSAVSAGTTGSVLDAYQGDGVYGDYSLRFIAGSGVGSVAGAGTTRTISAASGTNYVFSLYAKGSGSTAGKSGYMIIRQSGGASAYADSLLYFTWPSTWTRYSVAASLNAPDRTSLTTYIYLSGGQAGDELFTDAWQLEQSAVLTPYLDGSLGYGHTWDGTAHASVSKRTNATLAYAGAVSPSAFTVGGWFRSSEESSNVMPVSGFRPIFLQLGTAYYSSPGITVGRWYSYPNGVGVYAKNSLTTGCWSGNSLISLPFSPSDSVFLTLTYDGAAIRLYGAIAGGSTITSTSFADSNYGASPINLLLGLTNNQGGADVDELFVLDRAADADEIQAIYESDAPVFAESSTWSWAIPSTRVWADSEGLWAMDDDGNPIFAISSVDSKSWAGSTLDKGDVMMGRQGGYAKWDNSSSTMVFAGSGGSLTAISGGNITTGTVTATQIAASAITACKIDAGAIDATHISASAITACAIAANAINASHITASAITASKISANAIDASHITASAITACKIDAGAIDATHIAASAITACAIGANVINSTHIVANTIETDDLRVGGKANLLNNFSSTSSLTGWAVGGNATYSLVTASYSGSQVVVFRVSGSGNNYAMSNLIDVDPNQSYEVRASIYSAHPDATGNRYVTIYAYDQGSNLIPMDYVTPGASAITGSLLYAGLWGGAVYNGSTLDLVGYVAGANTCPTEIPYGRASLTASVLGFRNLRMRSHTRYLRMFLQNTENGAVTVTNEFYSPTIAPAISTQIHGSMIVDGTVYANKVAASSISASNIQANAVTAGTVAASAISACKISAGAIDATHISANAVTAAAISSSAITACKIGANVIDATHITASAITACKIDANAINSSHITASSITAAKISGCTITATELASNTITTEKLKVGSRASLINNFSISGNLTGWSTASTHSLATDLTKGTAGSIRTYSITSASDEGNLSTQCTVFDVDPTQTYEVRVSMYSAHPDNAGTRYFGLNTYDANVAAKGVTPFIQSSRTWSASSTNGYFWYGDIYGGAWVDFTVYILGCNVQDDEIPQGSIIETGGSVASALSLRHYRMSPEARFASIRFLNYYNAGAVVRNDIFSPTVTTYPITKIHGNMVVDGTIAASKLSVTQLSAITASMGDITAGSITGAEIRTASNVGSSTGPAGVRLNASGITGYSSGSIKEFYMDAATGAAYAGGSNVKLSATGITLVTADSDDTSVPSSRIKFVDDSDRTLSYIIGTRSSNNPALYLVASPYSGGTGKISQSVTCSASGGATVVSEANNGTYFSGLSLGVGSGSPTISLTIKESTTIKCGLVMNQSTAAITVDPASYLMVTGAGGTGGIYLDGAGNITYNGYLKPRRSSVAYNAYAYVPLTTPLTSTSWDGDAKSSGCTIINTASTFGIPSDAAAVSVRMSITYDVVGASAGLGPTLAFSNAIVARIQSAVAAAEVAGIVPISSGALYFNASEALDAVTLVITGYFI